MRPSSSSGRLDGRAHATHRTGTQVPGAWTHRPAASSGRPPIRSRRGSPTARPPVRGRPRAGRLWRWHGRVVRPDRPVHRRRPRRGRLPGARGPRPAAVLRRPGAGHRRLRAATVRAPTSGSLADAGIDEIRFAGATWSFGAERAAVLAVFDAPGLTADLLADFYEPAPWTPTGPSSSHRPTRSSPAGPAIGSTPRPASDCRPSSCGHPPNRTG